MTTALRGALCALFHRILGLPGIRGLFEPLLRAEYTIRRVNPDADLDALATCAAALSNSRPETIRQDFCLEFAERDPQRWLFLIAADAKGKVLGFVRAMRQGSEQDWWIVGLGVRPLYRRCRIGEALVNGVLAYLREDGVSTVRLEANRASRPAIALYRKLGFKEVARLGERAGEDDFLRMILDLSCEGSTDRAGQSFST